ncbi:maleylpyruvate isomerase N-terminal domain-containing protein [Nocardioides dubius]|uniref:Maleylpyruvate isomerase family mycothiol-dependent enzyme n=1 Tax=Nocardioides dubius TaxID=317019 RepID=A0ABN1TUH9_9ACTN
MIAATAPVALLGQAIAFTCDALALADSVAPTVPTPCRGWALGDLLDHMADGLDAFTEASNGLVAVTPVAHTGIALLDVRAKARALLSAWQQAPTEAVRIADVEVGSDVLLHAAALEITVHGWDVAVAVSAAGAGAGAGPRIPTLLALDLMPAAHLLLRDADRTGRFAAPVPVAPDAPAGVRLLALLGRTACS